MYSALSEVPNSKAVAGVRIGLVGDKFIVNPTTKEMEDSELDLVLAGTDSAILMIEASSIFKLSERVIFVILLFVLSTSFSTIYISYGIFTNKYDALEKTMEPWKAALK